jgi:translation initiation factor 3 subunit E
LLGNRSSPDFLIFSGLSQTLNLDQEAGEKWIVNLIRDTRVDAKIDFKEVCFSYLV